MPETDGIPHANCNNRVGGIDCPPDEYFSPEHRTTSITRVQGHNPTLEPKDTGADDERTRLANATLPLP